MINQMRNPSWRRSWPRAIAASVRDKGPFEASTRAETSTSQRHSHSRPKAQNVKQCRCCCGLLHSMNSFDLAERMSHQPRSRNSTELRCLVASRSSSTMSRQPPAPAYCMLCMQAAWQRAESAVGQHEGQPKFARCSVAVALWGGVYIVLRARLHTCSPSPSLPRAAAPVPTREA